MARIVVVSFRLGARDGVSIEAAKWIGAFTQLGHRVTTVAGEGDVDVTIPALAIGATTPPSAHEVTAALGDADLVVVENLVSLPLNVAARDVLYSVLRGRPVLFRHHDLAWQREPWRDAPAPLDDASWRHVVINERSRHELEERGVRSVTMRNTFDCDPPPGRRESTRRALGVHHERVVLMPTRAIARKNVAGATQLADSLGAVLWLIGPADDGYGPALDALVASSRARVIQGLPEGLSMHDAYAGCDLVTLPSTWEGFGNATLESVTHRRALAAYPYPVLEEIRSFGFRFFDLADVEALGAFLNQPDDELLEHNLTLARNHFNLARLPAQLKELLESMGVR